MLSKVRENKHIVGLVVLLCSIMFASGLILPNQAFAGEEQSSTIDEESSCCVQYDNIEYVADYLTYDALDADNTWTDALDADNTWTFDPTISGVEIGVDILE